MGRVNSQQQHHLKINSKTVLEQKSQRSKIRSAENPGPKSSRGPETKLIKGYSRQYRHRKSGKRDQTYRAGTDSGRSQKLADINQGSVQGWRVLRIESRQPDRVKKKSPKIGLDYGKENCSEAQTRQEVTVTYKIKAGVQIRIARFFLYAESYSITCMHLWIHK